MYTTILSSLPTESPALATMAVASGMLGMLGAKGIFGALFMYTPELYPTNIRCVDRLYSIYYLYS